MTNAMSRPRTRTGPVGRSLAASLLVAILVATGLGLSPSAEAASSVHVVAPWGDDSGPGTDASPWQTLRHAMGELVPGDTLLVREGTYKNQLTYVAAAGKPGAWIRVQAYPGEKPVLVGTDEPDINGDKVWGAIHLVEPAAYLEFRGFVMRGQGVTPDVAGLSTWRTHHVLFRGNNVGYFGGGGVNVVLSENIRIVKNNIHHNAFTSLNQTSGISIYEPLDFDGQSNGYSIEIRNNRIWKNENKVPNPGGLFTDGNCIVLDRYDDVDYYERTIVANNICYGNGGRGVHIFKTDNVDVINNTLYKNSQTELLTGEGELSTFEADNVNFINNLVYPREGFRGVLPHLSTNLTYRNNLYVMPGNYWDWQVSQGPGDRVRAKAGFFRPSFRGNASFRLKPWSPAIDRGLVTPVTYDWAERPRDARPDIGAIERQ